MWNRKQQARELWGSPSHTAENSILSDYNAASTVLYSAHLHNLNCFNVQIIDKRHEPNEHLSGHLYNLDKYLHCLNTVIIILSVPAVVKTIPRKFLKYKYNATMQVHIVLLNLSLNAAPCHTLRQLWSVHEVIMGWHYMWNNKISNLVYIFKSHWQHFWRNSCAARSCS